MRSRFMIIAALMLGACMPAPQNQVARNAVLSDSTLPPVKRFSGGAISAPRQSNIDLAEDFLSLSFQLEGGSPLPVFTRFEGPITVRLAGKPPSTLQPDLTQLLSRLRREAGISITQTGAVSASITIEAVSRREIRKVLPRAACFVAPNVTSLREYAASRRKPKTDWTLLTDRTRLAIFLPHDASPQEARDCLHEELAQAIGPLNDLYRLPNSVFNDDNVHTVLTGFDMLMLRAYYAPELRNGMTRKDVAAALPGIFARINPAGMKQAPKGAARTPQAWNRAIETALGRGSSPAARQRAVNEAIRIAAAQGWNDHRRAFAHYAKGRLLQASDPEGAYAHYTTADRFYAAQPETQLHRAYVATQLGAFAIRQGDAETALRIVAPHVAIARANENAALLSTLLLLRAEALDLQDRTDEARAVRLDSLGWARYGFGPDWAVRAKLREIASLNPLNG